jgi:alpha-ketoglutarate-dependent taurine dioxygenase
MNLPTRSGAGILLDARDVGPLDAPDLGERLEDWLHAHRFAVLRGVLRDPGEAVALLTRLGPVNHAETRKDGAVLVEAERDDEVFRSNHPLPMHKDGILTGFDVWYVGIHCVEHLDVTGGRTYVSDARRALERMDPADVALLHEHGVEGMAVDRTGYYRAEYEGTWHRVQAFRARGDELPGLHLGLPHAPGEPESWRVRVADVEPAVSDRVLGRLRSALFDPDHVYYHEWREGDMLLMDNYAVLHGREGFTGRRRRLANIQVLAR